ncbi:MAG: hypothetical protein JNN07_18560 [Verrucomicrobiales bacterium]|nr:hypothetical protein [Verrucomicrobiales bacterium]
MNTQPVDTMIPHQEISAERDRRSSAPTSGGFSIDLVSRWIFGLALALTLGSAPTYAGLPEPDAVVYGAIALDGRFVKATDTTVVVDLRATPDGPVLASYRMGASPRAGDRYVLRITTESSAPVLQQNTVPLGSTVLLTLRDASGPRDTTTLSITNRGQFIRFDFGDVDTDGDGMSDRYEQQYFGSATGGSPNADPDGDGRPNRREAQQGTNPLRADGRHPADLAPMDDTLTIKEVTDYALAWQLGAAWSIEPTNIPIAYVTRAGALWKGGERYGFDNDPATNAPNWWVNLASPPAAVPALAGDSGVGPVDSWARTEAPARYSNGVPFVVKTQVQPIESVKVYAVEDRIPEGWLVRNISAGGRLDRVNRKIKWGPFFDGSARELTYQLVPTSELVAAVRLAGVASFDGSDVDIAGSRVMTGSDPAARLALSSTGAGQVRVAVRGVPGVAYRVERSSDLNQWVLWKTVLMDSASAGEAVWTEAIEGNTGYFRAVPEL